MDNSFKIDLDALAIVRTKYIDYLSKLETSLDNAKKGLDELKADKWQGKSKDVFFEESFEDWNKGVEKQIEKLEILKNLLVDAEIEFINLKYEGQKIIIE